VDQLPQISDDGRYWWDGRAWQRMPELSEDGTQWWNGHEWQPIPTTYGEPAERRATAIQRSPSIEYEPPGGWGPPGARAQSMQPEAPTTKPGRNIAGDIVLWAGIAVGFGIALVGAVFIVEVRSATELKATGSTSLSQVAAGVTVAVLVIATGLGACLAFGFRLLGLSLWAAIAPAVRELAIFGSLVLFLLITGDIVLLVSPPGTFPISFSLGALLTLLYKAWRGKLLAAGTLGVPWVLSLVIQLPSAHLLS